MSKRRVYNQLWAGACRSEAATLQETPKFLWARLFSSVGPRKYNVIFVSQSDRRKCVLFSWASEDFRRQVHENTKGIFVGLGTDETV
jgi:hypothetical protein